MSPENQTEGTRSGMTRKQKLIAVGVIIVVLIIIWQVIGLFSDNDTTAITPVAPASNNRMTAPKPPASPAQMTNTAPSAQPNMPPRTNPQMAQQPPPQAAPQTPPEAVLAAREQQEQQKRYLSTVNELEMLKLQRDIAETNQAIAAAKLATVTAEKNVNDLLTKPAPPPIPVGDYASKLVSPVSAGTQQVVIPGPVEPASSYVVISVSMQLNRWTAVLGNAGKLYYVSAGDVLPPDGSVVVSISKSGVVLRKNGIRKKISLVPMI